MKALKFRAYDKENKRFDYYTVAPVILVHDENHVENHGIVLQHLSHTGFASSKEELKKSDEAEAQKRQKSNYESMDLATGYKDVAGRQVYEGDLLQFVDRDEDDHSDPMEVILDHGVFTLDGSAIWDYAVWSKDKDGKIKDPTYELENLEVVGNKFEGVA